MQPKVVEKKFSNGIHGWIIYMKDASFLIFDLGKLYYMQTWMALTNSEDLWEWDAELKAFSTLKKTVNKPFFCS